MNLAASDAPITPWGGGLIQMTVDRDARKTAKKKWQKHAKDAEKRKEEAGVKRVRKKANAKRRLCAGMCYQDPSAAITEDDKRWGNNEDGDNVSECMHGMDACATQTCTTLAHHRGCGVLC